MSSLNKTPNLHLNLWAGSDKPKRTDFNNDNTILDLILNTHLNDTGMHFTQAEKELFNEPFKIGIYDGTGESSKIISLTFTPKIVFIFSNNMPFSAYDMSTNRVYSYAGIASENYSSSGVSITTNGFYVFQSTVTPSANNFYPCLNSSGCRYQYIAVK